MHNTNSTQPTPEAAQQPRPTAQKAEIIDETVQKLHLDEATAAAVRQILEPVEHGVSGSLVTLVAKALKHDDDVKTLMQPAICVAATRKSRSSPRPTAPGPRPPPSTFRAMSSAAFGTMWTRSQ